MTLMIPRTNLRGIFIQPAQARIAGYGDVSPILGPEDLVYYNNGFLPAGASQSISGGILGSISDIVGGVGSIISGFQRPSFGSPGPLSAPTQTTVPSSQAPGLHPVLTAGGMSPTMGGPVGVRRGRYAPVGTKGYHEPKHRGGCSRVPAGMWVRNRHRNPLNVHAIRRSISRLRGFERIARHVIHFTHPRRSGGVAHFKGRKKSR